MKKKYIPILTFISILLINVSASFAKERPYFIRMGVEAGLAQNTVYCILQDRQGFMWFGTKDGLSRYDGCQFENYRNDKNDSCSIGNNCIRTLFQDADDRIWIGTDAGVSIYYPKKDCFESFDIKTKDGEKIEKEVNDIKQDKTGTYWFAVDWQGIFSYNPAKEELLYHKLNAIVNTWCICVDDENNVWIGTHGGGLNCFNREKQQFEKVDYSSNKEGRKKEDDIYRIFQGNYNDLLITTANSGAKRFNPTSKEVRSFLSLKDPNSLFIRDVVRKSNQELWFATGAGVCIYNTVEKKTTFLRNNVLDPYSLSDNAVYSVYKDKEGGVWVGTYFGGINYYPPQYSAFDKYYPISSLDKSNTLFGRRIREFQLAQDGCIWIGTEDGGLNLYNPNTDTFEHYLPNKKPGSISYNNVHGLLIDDDLLWVGTYSRGLDVMSLKTKKVIAHYEKTDAENSLCDNRIFSIYKDHSGRIWIGTLYGLCYYNPDGDDFIRVSSLGDIFVNDILQTKDGMIWVGSLGKGLYQFNPNNKKWTSFKNDPKDPTSLSHNKVISLFEDSGRILWITTEGGGLCKYNPEKKNFTSFTTAEGLPNNVVYKIVEDNLSNLWFTTNQGIVCMNTSDYSIKRYTRSDGLLSNQFNYKSGIRVSNGDIYFGGLKGFVKFNPALFVSNKHAPSVYIVDFELLNATVKPREEGSPLKYSIAFTREIELKHNQSTFSFSFVSLSYVAPEKNRYAYILDGFDEDWISPSKIQKASYSNVPPGEYTFKVKASNNDGVWSDEIRSIRIRILPPFYKTIWAYIFYAVIAISFIISVFVFYSNKIRKKNERRKEIFENEKSKEIYDAKIAFFTTITHEIRTPLSLIKGPLEYLIRTEMGDAERKEYLNVMERNTNRLLDLSNQLLDFRKTEQKGLRLNFTSIDIKQLVNDIYTCFNVNSIMKGVDFEVDMSIDAFCADVDKEALTKIISNLLDNATKYTKSEINLSIKKEMDFFQITISNDGNKLRVNQQEKIFEPFYQVTDGHSEQILKGVGLGLPLARSLAELHGGSLTYIDSEDQYNRFKLILPISQSISVEITPQKIETTLDISPKSSLDIDLKDKEKHAILVVEDDEELRIFLCKQLKLHYMVFSATNGKQALDILDNRKIDLIITDIVMPVMGGLQLCKEIKSNIDYSHIPIVMLTAKTNLQSEIDGLEAGTDAYVKKPFSIEHLFAQISNLLSNRRKLRETFVNSPFVKTKSIASSKADENFLKEVTQLIHENISDIQFNVVALANALNMSRSSLHRKIKGISELTPNEFILLVKLKKAAECIVEGCRINEVCFIVGFNSPSYFSKVFKKQFGLSPTEWYDNLK